MPVRNIIKPIFFKKLMLIIILHFQRFLQDSNLRPTVRRQLLYPAAKGSIWLLYLTVIFHTIIINFLKLYIYVYKKFLNLFWTNLIEYKYYHLIFILAKRLSEKQKKEITNRFTSGEAIDKLAADYSCTNTTIIRNLKKS